MIMTLKTVTVAGGLASSMIISLLAQVQGDDTFWELMRGVLVQMPVVFIVLMVVWFAYKGYREQEISHAAERDARDKKFNDVIDAISSKFTSVVSDVHDDCAKRRDAETSVIIENTRAIVAMEKTLDSMNDNISRLTEKIDRNGNNNHSN